MNIVDGRKIADKLTEEVKAAVGGLSVVPKITVIACDPNFETKKFLALKKAKAENLGIEMKTIILSPESTTEDLVKAVLSESTQSEGLIVQLPLPAHIDTDSVLGSIPKQCDVDVFGYQGEETDVLPPVIGAIDEISKFYQVDWSHKRVVIFGSGRLVGAPALFYAKAKDALAVEVVTEHSKDIENVIKEADIIILGVGKPNLLRSDMVKDGVVVFDAGASEDGGLLVGDAEPALASKALLLTPVPGGIGPITVILLFRNLLRLRNCLKYHRDLKLPKI